MDIDIVSQETPAEGCSSFTMASRSFFLPTCLSDTEESDQVQMELWSNVMMNESEDPYLSDTATHTIPHTMEEDLNAGPFRGPIPSDEELQSISDFLPGPDNDTINGPVLVNYKVKPIEKLVEFSSANKFWHIKSGVTGNLSISFTFADLPEISEGAEFHVRFELKRSNPSYQHLPVNTVCLKHQTDGNTSYPIIASTDTTNYTNYKESTGERRSYLLYNIGKPTGGSQLAAEANLRFPCYDTCINTDFVEHLDRNPKSGKLVMKEKSRFLELCVTLESHYGEIRQEIPLEEEICIPVWIKASVASREMKMRQRHSLKGGAAIKGKTKKRSLPSTPNSDSSQDKRQKRTDQTRLPHLVETFRPDQKEIWTNLMETLNDDQKDMLQNIMT